MWIVSTRRRKIFWPKQNLIICAYQHVNYANYQKVIEISFKLAKSYYTWRITLSIYVQTEVLLLANLQYYQFIRKYLCIAIYAPKRITDKGQHTRSMYLRLYSLFCFTVCATKLFRANYCLNGKLKYVLMFSTFVCLLLSRCNVQTWLLKYFLLLENQK